MKNFTRLKGEKPYYYSSTVENGIVVKHEGEPEFAVYESEMQEISRRADLWHEWVENNFPDAYDSLGIINQDIMFTHKDVCNKFMDGE